MSGPGGAAVAESIQLPLAETVAGLLAFIDRHVVPIESANADLLSDPRRLYDESGRYSADVIALRREVRQASARAGYYAVGAPADLGGGGADAVLQYAIWESLCRRYGPGRILPYDAVAHWTAGPGPLLAALSAEARSRVLDDLISGRAITCFALSESAAGSDVWAIQTRAGRRAGGWIVNGTKQWISNAPVADYAVVFSVTDGDQARKRLGGLSAFLVPMDSPGVALDRVIRLYGHIGGKEGIVSFSDVAVEDWQLLGVEGQGFKLAMAGVSVGRVYNCARSVGLARWALERTLAHVSDRVTFGRPLSDRQAIRFMLADCATQIYAADSMAKDCTGRIAAGEPAVKELAMAKVFATKMCTDVFDACTQAHGASGLTNEMHLYDGWQQARTIRIADGSDEILRKMISDRLFRGA